MNAEVTVSDNSKKHSEKKKIWSLSDQKKHTLFYTYYVASSLRAEISPVFFFMHSEIVLKSDFALKEPLAYSCK